MALKALLLVLAPLATALVPPCLPELGPQFCPGSAETAGLDIWDEHNIEKRALSPTIYPVLTQEALLKEKIFPLLVCSSPHWCFRLVADRIVTNSQNKTDLEEGIRLFTLPRWKPNRYCKSKFGVIAKDWISEAVEQIMQKELHLPNGSSMPISFRWINNETPQKSIILRILTPAAPYEPGNTIVLGAHMDSINANPPRNQSADRMIAPGADDNASGTMVLLTVLKVLGKLFAEKPVANEVQFHWYGAEEIGLKGSESVFASLRNESFTVKAMLNLDMVGYAGAHDPGSPKIALQKGFANQNLTDFVAKLVTTVSVLSMGGRAVQISYLPMCSTPMLSLASQVVAILAQTMPLLIATGFLRQ